MILMMMARKDFVNSIYQCLLLLSLLFKERVKMWMLFFWNEIFFFNHHIKIKSSDQQHKRNVKKIWYFLIRFFLLISPNIQITEWISFFSRRRFWLIKRSGWDMRKKMIEEKWGGNDLVVIDDVSLLFDYIKTKIIDWWLILLKFKAKNEWNLNKTQIFLFFFFTSKLAQKFPTILIKSIQITDEITKPQANTVIVNWLTYRRYQLRNRSKLAPI